MTRKNITHPIPPTYDENSRILILGSFPSVKSRECGYFYGHPSNRFWKVVAAVFEDDVPGTVEGKRAFLLKHGIAVWDVIASCSIEGSSDSSIKDVVPNDLTKILAETGIRKIFVNGRTAEKMYRKYTQEKTGIEAVCLPSTSPANAVWKLDMLIEEWGRLILGKTP